jgi:hypothetical protein
MSRLGWHFVFVGTFAMMGGAIRGFNLPLVLSGLIVGALLMQWRLARRMMEAIENAKAIAQRSVCGPNLHGSVSRVESKPLAASVVASDRRSNRCTDCRYRACRLAVQTAIQRFANDEVKQRFTSLSSLFHRESTQIVASCGVGRANAKHNCRRAVRLRSDAAGRYDFGPSTISTGMPLGLMTIRRAIGDHQSLYVFPQILPLKRDWRRRLQSRSGGIATTARRSGANDGDFFGLRSWQAGDSRRWIHWRTTARIGEPAVRQFEQQKRFELCVLVDAFLPAANAGSLTGAQHCSSAHE